MAPSTNQLVSNAKKLSVPAAIAGAFVLGAAFFAGHGPVRAAAAMPLDDNSISALTSLDHAMEAVASKVTPAVVNVAVTSRGPSEEESMNGNDSEDGQNPQQGQAPQLPPGLRQFFGNPFGGFGQMPSRPQIEHGVGSG